MRILNMVKHLQWHFFAEILNFLSPLKMVLWEIWQNSQDKIFAGISFFDKVKLCRSAASGAFFYSVSARPEDKYDPGHITNHFYYF